MLEPGEVSMDTESKKRRISADELNRLEESLEEFDLNQLEEFTKRLQELKRERARYGDFYTSLSVHEDIISVEERMRALEHPASEGKKKIGVSALAFSVIGALATVVIALLTNVIASDILAIASFEAVMLVITLVTALASVALLLGVYYRRKERERELLIDNIRRFQTVVEESPKGLS
jgi:hypothetical protein